MPLKSRHRTFVLSTLTTAVALGAASLVPGGSVATAAALANKTAGVTALPWSYQAVVGRRTYSSAESVAQAQRFDLIAANWRAYGSNVPKMRAANSQLRLLAYVNGAYAQKSQATAFPESWYLRTKAGAKVRSIGYGNYLMDVTNPGWISSVVSNCKSALKSSGFDGCFIDMMGTASIMSDYTTGTPLDPDTGKPFTAKQWLTATSHLSQTVKSQTGAATPTMVNGLGSGPRYFDPVAPSSQVMTGIDGALAESWLRGGFTPLSAYPSEDQWKDSVNMMTDGAAKGKSVLITVKAWGNGTAAQRDAWHVYSLASYLMGADGKARFSFLPSVTSDPTAADPLLEGLDIGQPTAAYAKSGGVYVRPFSHGRVVVNPTSATITVKLPSLFKNGAGARVSSVQMKPDTAQILTSTS